jgi:hypothetical protein
VPISTIGVNLNHDVIIVDSGFSFKIHCIKKAQTDTGVLRTTNTNSGKYFETPPSQHGLLTLQIYIKKGQQQYIAAHFYTKVRK